MGELSDGQRQVLRRLVRENGKGPDYYPVSITEITPPMGSRSSFRSGMLALVRKGLAEMKAKGFYVATPAGRSALSTQGGGDD